MERTKNDREKKNRGIGPVDVSNLVYGKVPPNAKDLEELVLGVIMIEPGSVMRNVIERNEENYIVSCSISGFNKYTTCPLVVGARRFII